MPSTEAEKQRGATDSIVSLSGASSPVRQLTRVCIRHRVSVCVWQGVGIRGYTINEKCVTLPFQEGLQLPFIRL